MAQDQSQVLIQVGAQDNASGVLAGAFGKIDGHFAKLIARTKEAQSKIARFSTDAAKMSGKFEKWAGKSPFGGGMLGGGLLSQLPIGHLAVGGALTAIVKNFASLEDAMVDVGSAIEGLTESQKESLKKKIMDVGEEFPVSNVDVARTTATMGRMGFDFNAIMAGLRRVVMLDLGSGTNDPNTTANAVISVMQSLDKNSEELEKLTDQMMATKNFFERTIEH